jgi:hypothetical protein
MQYVLQYFEACENSVCQFACNLCWPPVIKIGGVALHQFYNFI